ncbi:TetR family transcriptional regulator C-terminal domain-containing protein [Kribbella italica]|uniref:AcrR family transcriptional regulator n=1 Tax=Kribbella italica TaxID=1540520 RepID=A0A7W9J8R1_9ACTN|nr:AcrR family transcriptional regulator [Kribbella italica]
MGNREKLLATAKRLIAEQGYGDITARDLVNGSGTNLASIGYHFGSKEGLLTEAVLDSFAADEQAELLGELSGRSPAARLAEVLDVLGQLFGEDPRRTTASIEAFARSPHSPEIKERLATVYQQSRRGVAAAVLGKQPDEVDDATAQRVGSLALALIDGVALQALVDPEHAPTGADVVAALRLLVK